MKLILYSPTSSSLSNYLRHNLIANIEVYVDFPDVVVLFEGVYEAWGLPSRRRVEVYAVLRRPVQCSRQLRIISVRSLVKLLEESGLAQWGKVRDRVLGGQSDANIPFKQLCNMLIRLGFSERITGSHHTFTRDDIPDIIVMQPSKGEATAKRYQVKQVRELLLKYGLR